MTSVHISDVRTFKQCRQKWDFTSPLRRNLRARRPPIYYVVGALVHSALEQYYQGAKYPLRHYDRGLQAEVKRIRRESPEFTGSQEEIDFLGDLQTGRGVVAHYMQWADKADDFDMIHPEIKPPPIKLPGSSIQVSGRFDGIIQRGEHLWLKEFKTAVAIPTDFSFLTLDEQASLYLWMAREHFQKDIKGVLYTYLRKKVPTVPKLLKSGELSQAKNIDTTAEVYYETIRQHDLNPLDYVEMLRFLNAKPNNFFKRYQVRRSPGELRRFIEQFTRIAEMMVDPDVEIYPNPGQWECNQCPFFGPCSLSQSNPGMVDALLEANYTKNVWRN